jgi:uncharacterized protein
MKNFALLIIFVAFLGTALSSNAQDVQIPVIDFGPRESLTIVSNDTPIVFSIEVADSQAELSRGMMYRESVAPNEGMLFEFGDEEIVSIWMKNTSIPLDVIFVRADGRILKIEHSAKPYSLRSMTSEAPVTAVFEVAGGQANALGLRPGDILQHSYFKTAP